MRARVQATLSRLGFDRFHPTPILWSGSMRGCSLMVKPQSSKLITRVRFPSSPPLQRLRRKRRGLLRSGEDGNRLRLKVPKAFETFRLQPVIPSRTILNDSLRCPYACGFVSSRARNPHAPARHPLHKSRSRLPGIAYGRKCIPSRARDFRPPARHPLENYPERIVRTASACRLVSSRARSLREPSQGLDIFRH